jgi:hypothetical protein
MRSSLLGTLCGFSNLLDLTIVCEQPEAIKIHIAGIKIFILVDIRRSILASLVAALFCNII